ncbi:hypothetical protein E2C01_052416 [Portunus trituberculatus]|uniref:Uncharacterized protein n=1 Tax=Portunus trituberculatus TaxID=210409 RepID=A0A5B7GEH3_PORTR|nr:hypothetical protein [Portunus trituberculatus]
MDNIEEEGRRVGREEGWGGGGRSLEDKSPSMKTSGVIPVNPLVEGCGSLTLPLSLDSLFSPPISLYGVIVSF